MNVEALQAFLLFKCKLRHLASLTNKMPTIWEALNCTAVQSGFRDSRHLSTRGRPHEPKPPLLTSAYKQTDTQDRSSFFSDHFKSVSAASQSNRTPGRLMHREHMRANASLSEPMPWGSNCFYLWWFPNHLWWGAWVVPCLAACERVNGWGLIAINCACVAFALMQPSHGAAGL